MASICCFPRASKTSLSRQAVLVFCVFNVFCFCFVVFPSLLLFSTFSIEGLPTKKPQVTLRSSQDDPQMRPDRPYSPQRVPRSSQELSARNKQTIFARKREDRATQINQTNEAKQPNRLTKRTKPNHNNYIDQTKPTKPTKPN